MESDARKKDGKFVKGHGLAGPGRPKGSRSKLSEAFLKTLAEDWQEHGLEVVQQVRANDPSTYMRVIASLLPKDVNLNADISYTGVPIPVSERAPLDAPARTTNGRDLSTRH